MNKTDVDERGLSFFNEGRQSGPDKGITFSCYYDELMKASIRMGIDSEIDVFLEKKENLEKIDALLEKFKKNEIQWLLNFVDLDLSAISSGDWINIQYEFLAFQQGTPLARVDAEGELVIRFPTKKDIELFLSSITNELNRLIDEGCAVFDTGPIVLYVEGRLGKEGIRHVPWEVSPVAETRWGASQYRLSVLIARYAHLTRRCPECNIFFLADRKNQSYCSLKHQNYAAGRKYRKSKGLITGRKRGRPRKQDTPKKEGGS